MKKVMLMLLAIMAIVSGCIKDTLRKTYTYRLQRPVYQTSTQVREAVKNESGIPISQPGKLYLFGDYIFLNEIGRGIHIINNANPAKPVNQAFIKIPGCEDMAVQGTILFADCYTDMVVLDISNPAAVKVKKWINNIFPERQYVLGYKVDSGMVIAEWISKDTTVTEKSSYDGAFWRDGRVWMDVLSSSFSNSGTKATTPTGKSGSMARFTITKQHLYTVTQNKLNVLDIRQPENPNWKKTIDLIWGIETIYPFKNNLFIGSNTGMLIFNIDKADDPKAAGTFSHARVCDPVIADDNYAYVTLRSGTQCAGFTNQLDVVDIKNIYSPSLVKSYPLTNPKGLDKQMNWLFVCDGNTGLKVLDITNVQQVSLKNTIAVNNAYDVICWNGIAMVSAADGLYQFDISNVDNIKPLSYIGLQP